MPGLCRSDLLIHAGSSLTLVSEVPVETDMYRCGALLYGILRPDWGFVPTMEVAARVVSVLDYPNGAYVGYDNAARLTRDSRLACVSIGYQNGFDRGATEAAVLIRDQRAPVVGKVSMNALIVDVTGIGGVSVGDVATVFGQGHRAEIPQATVERQFGTIMADLYTDWGLRNPRLYA
ncbi:alanine racemase C-terminal domain-containing protein [Tropicibacter naphthalenivorans]|uniref:alanine racemase n=1 Tax=Tropicibacter naphthalenivorans TaxID=441103 RepID=A0A0N7M119_9RHOB|nr:alanine racemase C-terminal domain-containing protein [Tropicibacter naphthalenivorans]CUH82033.1 Lysine/arginine racemase precursor [Tropicibacter naphthalenivorans]SMD08243.1 Alanine racemase, C-terminal domain [Tropicibacter naphthalenivorans]